jgi:ferredoxin-NADP reductase
MPVRLLMAARVTDASRLAPSVRSLTFAPIHRRTFPSFRGGEHVQVQLPDGRRREYSLCGPRSDSATYEVAVLQRRDGRGGSRWIHDALNVGDEVFVSYPLPGMTIERQARRHIFVAGGIGITAIVGLLQDLPQDATGEIHYCVHSRSNAVFVDRLHDSGLPVYLHCSDEDGRLDIAALLAPFAPGTHLYQCGPDSLMAAVDEASSHWEAGHVHREAFEGTVAAVGERQGDSFAATLLVSKKTVTVLETETLLGALHKAGIPLEFSCEGGVCGTCIVELVSGSVDHRDRCLTDRQRMGGQLTACVSRGRGPVALQL